jgi:hypothetical protein
MSDVAALGADGERAVTRLKKFLTIGLLAGVLFAPAAQADIVGTLVNALMEKLLYGKPAQRPAPAPTDNRIIPESAYAGVMSPPEGRMVSIDGKDMLLAPGSKIRDLDNRIIRPGALNHPVQVRYTLDRNAQVHHVWVLARR